MDRMNKPTYPAIYRHSPRNPFLIFVSSRQQTKPTVLDLINIFRNMKFVAADEHPVQFLAMLEQEGHIIHKGCRLILVLMYQVKELHSKELKRLGMRTWLFSFVMCYILYKN